MVAAGALALFGCGFVALSGVLIAWGSRLAPEAAAQATALLFIALVTGQAGGAALLGALADAAPFLAAGEDERYQAEVLRLAPAEKADPKKRSPEA